MKTVDAPTIAAGDKAIARPLPSPTSDDAGEQLRYSDEGLIGQGGMGQVRLVRDLWIGREIAAKYLSLDDRCGFDARSRFLREARVQGQLEHPAIVPVYDMGVDAEGRQYFTMKRVSGQTLADILHAAVGDDKARSEFSRGKLLAIFRQVCLAVEYAHTRGVVHRDLKPANLMVGNFGEVYVLDWGLAKLIAPKRTGIDSVSTPVSETVMGQILGTPGYMPPEQIAGADDIDARADVYALGAILFEILALEPLHQGETVAALLRSTQLGEERSPAARAPDREVPPELDEICVRATVFDPSQRIGTPRELAEAVERYLEGDRDLAARAALARAHAAAAETAAALAHRGGPESADARARALQEAGSALTLDPGSVAARQVAARLLLEPPADAPPEVLHNAEHASYEAFRENLRIGFVTFAAMLLVVASLPLWFEVRSSLGLVLIAAPLTLGTMVQGLALLRARTLDRLLHMNTVVNVFVFASIAATSGIAGAAILVPALVVALTTGSMMATSKRAVGAHVGLGLASFFIPFAAEWAGLLPRAYDFRADGVLVSSVVLGLSEVSTRIGIIIATVAAVLGSALATRRAVESEAETRRKWLVQLWHLRAMTSVVQS
jgi:serine/threonine-protein kinase